MSKTITLDDEAYKTLVSLKEGPGDSFTKVIRLGLSRRLETAGEILAWHESQPLPKVDLEILDRVIKGRGRGSGGRKRLPTPPSWPTGFRKIGRGGEARPGPFWRLTGPGTSAPGSCAWPKSRFPFLDRQTPGHILGLGGFIHCTAALRSPRRTWTAN